MDGKLQALNIITKNSFRNSCTKLIQELMMNLQSKKVKSQTITQSHDTLAAKTL